MRHFRQKQSALFRHLLAVAEGMFWVAGGGALCAGLLLVTGVLPAAVLHGCGAVLWCGGAFMAGRRAGLHGRRHGLLSGLCCGVLLMLVLLCGTVLLRETAAPGYWLRCLLLLPSGASGGGVGVNSRVIRGRRGRSPRTIAPFPRGGRGLGVRGDKNCANRHN